MNGFQKGWQDELLKYINNRIFIYGHDPKNYTGVLRTMVVHIDSNYIDDIESLIRFIKENEYKIRTYSLYYRITVDDKILLYQY